MIFGRAQIPRKFGTWLFASLAGLVGFPLAASEADWTLRRFVPPQGTNFEEVRDIVVDGLDGVWFSSWGNGVARLKESEWKLFSLEGHHLPSDFVPSLAWDPDNRLMWAGTDEGLIVLSGDTAIAVPLPEKLVEGGFEITFVHRLRPANCGWVSRRRSALLHLRSRL